jgi:hypothetical protein
VAGVGVALLAGDFLGQGRIVLASLVGVIVAGLMMAAFLAYQRWRYRIFDTVEARAAGV